MMQYIRALADWQHLSFAYPWAFAGLFLIPFLLVWQWRARRRAHPALRLTTTSGLAHIRPGLRTRLRPLLTVLRVLSIAALVAALARPQSSSVSENVDSEGIDIVLAMDISGSMLAEDFKPNRIEASKRIATDFINGRPGDRIGLVIFSGESFTQCPVTIDHRVLLEQVANVESGALVDGTAIGDGLATAVDRIRNTTGKSRVIILLTDGRKQYRQDRPRAGAGDREDLQGARVHDRHRRDGPGPLPGADTDGHDNADGAGADRRGAAAENREGDRRQLLPRHRQQLAQGHLRADRQAGKTKVEISSYKHFAELFFPLAMLACACIFLEMLLRWTVFRSIT